MLPVVHIGPSKTASTTLQKQVLPFLGRPYKITPQWLRLLSRSPEFTPPEASTVPDGMIFSAEMVGDFPGCPPAEVARRLMSVLGVCRIVFVEREPIELFASLYQQYLVNNQNLITRGYVPLTPDALFDHFHAEYVKNGTGIFATINVPAVEEAFYPCEFVTIPYALLEDDGGAFGSAFALACGAHWRGSLTRLNPSRLPLTTGLPSPDRQKFLLDSYVSSMK